MEAGLISDKILSTLIDGLSIEELEVILAQKKTRTLSDYSPKPMTEKQRLKEHYRRLMISKGAVFAPKHTNG